MTEPADDLTLDHRPPVWAREAARKRERARGPSFKGLIVSLLGWAAVAAVAAFFLAPGVAFLGIRAAAKANDAAGLAQLVDYGQVRTALRAQIGERAAMPEAPPPSFLEDPIGAVRRQFQDHPIVRQPDVDAYLTAPALLALTDGAGRAASTAVGPVQGAEPWPRPSYWSVNRTRMWVMGPEGATVFTFERRGPFEWKLVHVGLPASPAA